MFTGQPVLGLIFFRYADHKFTEVEKKMPQQASGRRKIGKTDYQALYIPEKAHFGCLRDLPDATGLGCLFVAILTGDPIPVCPSFKTRWQRTSMLNWTRSTLESTTSLRVNTTPLSSSSHRFEQPGPDWLVCSTSLASNNGFPFGPRSGDITIPGHARPRIRPHQTRGL